jgi:hypothetical protein
MGLGVTAQCCTFVFSGTVQPGSHEGTVEGLRDGLSPFRGKCVSAGGAAAQARCAQP